MKVTITVDKPIAMPADHNGPAYNIYPIAVRGEPTKGRLTRTTLSVDESGVTESNTAAVFYKLSGRDYKDGTHPLFATTTDGTETVTSEASVVVASPSGGTVMVDRSAPITK